MSEGWEERRDCCVKFVVKFFSLIIAIAACFSTFIYAIGIFRYISAVQRFKRDEVAHFFGLGCAVLSSAMDLALHTMPHKAQPQSLTILTIIMIVASGMVGHSLGLAAPTVDDCDETNRQNFFNGTIQTVGQISHEVITSPGVTTGSLGQSLGNCRDMQLIFAGCFMFLFFQSIALFDIQRIILKRVRSKTYGDRFVEMGIR